MLNVDNEHFFITKPNMKLKYVHVKLLSNDYNSEIFFEV